jgi:hypothetical protein
MKQAERYATLYSLHRPHGGPVDSSYQAAFYLLSCDEEIFKIARRHIDTDGISFDSIKRSCRDFGDRDRQLLSAAHNLFSWTSKTTATPFEISRLGYPYMERVCNAIFIASGEMEVRILQSENEETKMMLDPGHYQQTARIYRQLANMSLQPSIPDLAEDEDYAEER